MLVLVSFSAWADLEAPVRAEEIDSCYQYYIKMEAWRRCQAAAGGEECRRLFQQYYSEDAPPVPAINFIEPFRQQPGGLDKYAKAVAQEAGDRLHRYPVKMGISVLLWLADGAALAFAPQFFPVVHGLTWMASAIVWGKEGVHLAFPCSDLTPNSPQVQIRRCLHVVKRKLSQVDSVDEIARDPQEFFREAAAMTNGLPFRFTCASIARSVELFDQEVESIRCENERVVIGEQSYEVRPDGSLQVIYMSLKIHIEKGGKLSVNPRFTEPHHLPLPTVKPSWTFGLEEITRPFWPHIEKVSQSCQ